MAVFLNFWVVIFSCSITICVSQLSIDIASTAIQSGTCVSDNVYQKLFNVPFHICVKECQLRARCHYILYKEEIKYCGLISDTNIALAQDLSVAQCIYINVDVIDGSSLGTCSNKPCNVTQRCVSNGTTYTCETSECLEPPEVMNGTLLSKACTVGDRITYTCEWSFVLVSPNDLFMTCMPDGQWFNPGLSCVKNCPRPKSLLENALLTNVSNPNMLVGTELTYECREHYRATHTHVKRVCNKNGHWNSRRIPCCREGLQNIYGLCGMLRIDNTSTPLRTNMLNSCKDDGMWMLSGLNKYKVQSILNQEPVAVDTIVFWSNKRHYEYNRIGSLHQYCFRQQYSAGTNMTLVTVDEMMEKGKAANPPCALAKRWFHGEPNGGENEQCIIAGINSDYLYADINCNNLPSPVGFICYEQFLIT